MKFNMVLSSLRLRLDSSLSTSFYSLLNQVLAPLSVFFLFTFIFSRPFSVRDFKAFIIIYSIWNWDSVVSVL